MHSLFALVVGLAGILQPAGIHDSDGLAGGGLRAGALLQNGLGDTHGEEDERMNEDYMWCY
jgi:hypothetical protein